MISKHFPQLPHNSHTIFIACLFHCYFNSFRLSYQTSCTSHQPSFSNAHESPNNDILTASHYPLKLHTKRFSLNPFTQNFNSLNSHLTHISITNINQQKFNININHTDLTSLGGHANVIASTLLLSTKY